MVEWSESVHVRVGENTGTLRRHGVAVEFAKKPLNEAKVCVSPGIGFMTMVILQCCFALTRTGTVRARRSGGIKAMFRADGLLASASWRCGQHGKIKREHEGSRFF